jgi:recombination associated protein RdgC
VFKNLIVYRLGPDGPSSMSQVQDALDRDRFIECGLTQPLSVGWVEPRGVANGPLIEVIDGQWLMTLQVEQRILPGAVVRRRAEELAEQVEKATGRKPGKKQMRELKDQATLDLLPLSFTKRAAVKLWIAPAQRLLMIDAGSASRADLALTQLTKSLVGVSAQGIQTTLSPAVAMSEWLASGEPPQGFAVDRDCELKAADGEKPVVRYARHPLDIAEIAEHLKAGKQPTRLALTWQGRVSFTLTDTMQIKKLAFLDGVFEGRKAGRDDEAYDADAAIATGELAPLIGDLIDALGGEAEIKL